jgi:hypothetical protein
MKRVHDQNLVNAAVAQASENDPNAEVPLGK